uniref:Uncharacterized protein n=1 Tax=uncultured Desulfobacterium sp. TaxID=201089 RepID=E1YJA7_9BACT|nr:unknown protein [uncultured Desulfobacterium sp.]
MINPYETTCEIISDLQDLFLKCLESVRPGKSYKHNFKKRNKKFHSAYRQFNSTALSRVL